MDITGKIEEVNQSDSLLLVVFYADWSPHCEWIEPLLHEFEKPVNIVRVNIESNRKVADAYEIEIAPSFVLQRKGKMLWEKTGEVSPGELRDVIEMFKNFFLVGSFVQWKTYRTFAKQLIKFKNICSEVILAESSDFPMQAKV